MTNTVSYWILPDSLAQLQSLAGRWSSYRLFSIDTVQLSPVSGSAQCGHPATSAVVWNAVLCTSVATALAFEASKPTKSSPVVSVKLLKCCFDLSEACSRGLRASTAPESISDPLRSLGSSWELPVVRTRQGRVQQLALSRTARSYENKGPTRRTSSRSPPTASWQVPSPAHELRRPSSAVPCFLRFRWRLRSRHNASVAHRRALLRREHPVRHSVSILAEEGAQAQAAASHAHRGAQGAPRRRDLSSGEPAAPPLVLSCLFWVIATSGCSGSGCLLWLARDVAYLPSGCLRKVFVCHATMCKVLYP